ncbi:MAG: DUF3307 domain-containing protein [Gemmataceae bacterium]|nr:DUF3307 domain-containing protein [Gemmataceae bacterium]
MELMLARFWWLLVGHAVGDFALQSEAMAIEKNRHSKSVLQRAVPWFYWLSAHSLLHGAAVGLITQSVWLGLVETVLHWVIDFVKCEHWTNIHQDQVLHILCKVAWAVLSVQVPELHTPLSRM